MLARANVGNFTPQLVKLIAEKMSGPRTMCLSSISGPFCWDSHTNIFQKFSKILSGLGSPFIAVLPSMIDRRDYTVGVPAEDLTRYCPGGYHPVHIGDSFNGGRYKILHKLGFGAFSTVWLARDLQYVQLHPPRRLRLLSFSKL